jgi:hypothetical protein
VLLDDGDAVVHEVDDVVRLARGDSVGAHAHQSAERVVHSVLGVLGVGVGGDGDEAVGGPVEGQAGVIAPELAAPVPIQLERSFAAGRGDGDRLYGGGTRPVGLPGGHAIADLRLEGACPAPCERSGRGRERRGRELITEIEGARGRRRTGREYRVAAYELPACSQYFSPPASKYLARNSDRLRAAPNHSNRGSSGSATKMRRTPLSDGLNTSSS